MRFFLYLGVLLLTVVSCGSAQGTYDTVVKNQNNFEDVGKYIIDNDILLHKGAIEFSDGTKYFVNAKCIYKNEDDRKINEFMNSLDINEICSYDDRPGELYFNFESAPYTSKNRVVYIYSNDKYIEFVDSIRFEPHNNSKAKSVGENLVFIFK